MSPKQKGYRDTDAAARETSADFAHQTAADGSGQAVPTQAATMPIENIRIGERFRKDLGDIEDFAAKIAKVGLLHPIGVRPDGTLAFGERRLRAAQLLGWQEIPVRIITSDAVAVEFIENTCRKDFTPSELVAAGYAIERIERERAKQRKAHEGRPGKLPERQTGDARDKIAAQLGISGKTYERAKFVCFAAAVEPEKYGRLLADMDRTGKVNGPYKRLTVMEQAAAIRREPPPLPGKGPYRVIVADPPWPYEKRSEDPTHRATYDYPTMSIAAICKLDVGSIAAPDSILWLWTINYFMREAYDVLAAWGFEAKTILTWVKPRAGFGDWLRGQTEHCILATRGKPIVTLTNQSTRLDAPVRDHSQKPIEFYDLVESLCPAPRYADVFSRYRHNERWDCHGNQAPGEYDATDDVWKSVEFAYDEIRKRKAAGGPGWPDDDGSAP
jgi:N6-adenosine-specific RNA methylase IME4